MQVKINWREYLGQFDIVYQMQARIWQDGMPLGNGSLGALVYEPFHPEWTINKTDVWDYRHPQFKRHSMEYLRRIVSEDKNYIEEMRKENSSDLGLYPCPKTCGQMRIRFGLNSIYAPAHRISKRLNLYQAAVHTNLDKHLSHPRITSFIHAEKDLMVVRVRNVSVMTAFHNNVDLYRVPDSNMPLCRKGAEGDTIWLDQSFHDGFRYIMMARIVPCGGGAYQDLFKETVQKKWWDTINPSKTVSGRVDGEYATLPVAGDFDIFLTVATIKDAEDPVSEAKQRLESAIKKGSAKLFTEHCRKWSKFWSKSYVGFSSSLLEQLWYVSLYNLATVLPGIPVAGLCGLWFGPMDTPSQILPWNGYYTNDYNAQLPIMPVFRANHPELSNGTFRTLLEQIPAAQHNAKTLYGVNGGYWPLSTDPTGEEITNGPYRLIQNSGPYWSVFLWWHYLYTGDKKYLKSVTYPIMREVASFFAEYLVWHPEENLYHLEISQNPELMYIKYSDPIDTMAFLKYTLTSSIQAARILGCDKNMAEKWQHILDHFPAYPQNGMELSPLRGLRPNHWTHLRTLAALFPCGEFDPEIDPEWLDACRLEINKMYKWGKFYACNKGRIGGYYTGLFYHIGMPACWLGMKKMAWGYLEDLLKTNVKPNGLISHNSVVLADSTCSEANIKNIPKMEIYHDFDPKPLKAVEVLNGRLMESTTENCDCRDTIFPAFEGPAAYLLFMGEAMLQSHNGILRFFQCLPEKEDAQFFNLRAQGPTLVSAARRKGEVVCVQIKALKKVQWKLKNPWKGKPVWMQMNSSKRILKESSGKYIELKLAAGETTILASQKGNLNFFESMRIRVHEQARARYMQFPDGMVVWLGKPEASEYYSVLESARDCNKS